MTRKRIQHRRVIGPRMDRKLSWLIWGIALLATIWPLLYARKRTAAPLGRRRVADVAAAANWPLTLLLLTTRHLARSLVEAVGMNASSAMPTRRSKATNRRALMALG
jgi:hypothetical protein